MVARYAQDLNMDSVNQIITVNSLSRSMHLLSEKHSCIDSFTNKL